MKEVLSQSEIDLLLNALSTGEVKAEELQVQTEQPKSRLYDFRRPNKFSQDQLRTLFFIHDNFGRLVSNFLSAYLRSNVQLKIASVDQATYEDFMVSIPTPTLLTAYSMAPLPGTAVMETNLAFIFPLIDLLFGGPGEMAGKLRELTEIEISVLRNLNARILENLAYVWSDIYQFEPRIESLETNPQLTQLINPNETVAIITLTSQVGKFQGLINLCLPFLTLEPVLPKLSARHWFASSASQHEPSVRERVVHNLQEAVVDLTVVGGTASLSVRDFLQLQVGDVITLDNQVGHDLTLLVEDRSKFKVQPGMLGKKMAVQVTAVLGVENQ